MHENDEFHHRIKFHPALDLQKVALPSSISSSLPFVVFMLSSHLAGEMSRKLKHTKMWHPNNDLYPLTPTRGTYDRIFARSILSKRRPKPKTQLQKIANCSYSLRDIAKIRLPSSQLFELSKFVYHSQSPKRPLEGPTGLF